MRGRPSWFIQPVHHTTHLITPHSSELYHWHHHWMLGDSLFWFLVILANMGITVCYLLLTMGLLFVHMAVGQWLDWIGGPALVHLPLLSFLRAHGFMIGWSSTALQLHSFLSTDVPASFCDSLLLTRWLCSRMIWTQSWPLNLPFFHPPIGPLSLTPLPFMTLLCSPWLMTFLGSHIISPIGCPLLPPFIACSDMPAG